MIFGKKNRRFKKFVLLFVGIMLLFAAILFIRFYRHYFVSNVNESLAKEEFIYIPTGATYFQVLKMLDEKNLLVNKNTFEWLCKQMDYPKNIHAGKYKITSNMSNYELIKMLRSGAQTPVKLVIGKFRLNQEFRNYIAKQLEPDSMQIQCAFDSIVTARKIDTALVFKDMTAYVMQNTYEFWWNTSPAKFWDKMFDAYDKFWNTNRKQKAHQLKLTPYQVATVASIVEEETAMDDEKGTIAGVYLNRLKKKMPLQADPTVRFALQDFTIHRVMFNHLKVESPYNTYLHEGLPPGPICIPALKTIDAVLNAPAHNYLYFCAREDFSGYSNFSVTYEEQMINAKNYQTAYINKFIKHMPDLNKPKNEPDIKDLNQQ